MNFNSEYIVYIMSNTFNTVLYIGFTNDIVRRVSEHKSNAVDGFTRKYNCHKLVYFECYDTWQEAKERETKLKKWNRKWKEELIDKMNEERNDLSEGWNLELSIYK